MAQQTREIQHSLVAVISDLHVSAGHLDEFRLDDVLAELLLGDLPRYAAGRSISLVIAGDFIDFPQILPALGLHPYGREFGTTEGQSQTRLQEALKAHPKVFAALGRFLRMGHQVLILPGNHDIDLHWPSVFASLCHEVSKSAGQNQAPRFIPVPGCLYERRLYIEHGNQYTPDNCFPTWQKGQPPLRQAPDGERLDRPFGTLLMDRVINSLQGQIEWVSKVYPHTRLAKIALRGLLGRQHVDQETRQGIWDLVRFFLHEGRGTLVRESRGLLGADNAQIAANEAVALLLEEVGADLSAAQRRVWHDEWAARVLAEPEEQTGLLGRFAAPPSDEERLRQQARIILNRGRADVVVFGHTHEEIDGHEDLIVAEDARDLRRYFNTGSWVERLIFGAREVPRLELLASQPRRLAPQVALIDTDTSPPTTALWPIPLSAPPPAGNPRARSGAALMRPSPRQIFVASASADLPALERLEKLLGSMDAGDFSLWSQRDLLPGRERHSEILAHLFAAHAILLFISPDFIGSEALLAQAEQARQRRADEGTPVIPVLLHPALYEGAWFAVLQALPDNAQPISAWPDEVAAWHNVMAGLRRALSVP